MKVVKLDFRHNLKRRGYNYAFRFSGWDSKANGVERIVKTVEGYSPNNTFWGKASNRYESRPYWVGFRNEATMTMVLLSMKE